MFDRASSSTDRDLDLAIKGNGFFMVKIYDDIGEAWATPATASSHMDENGDLVMSAPMASRWTRGDDSHRRATIDITSDGRVNVTTPSNATPTGWARFNMFTNRKA